MATTQYVTTEWNISDEIEDPVGEIEHELNMSHTIHLEFLYIILEFIKLGMCLVSFGAAVFLLVLLCRCQKLQTKLNSYLKHYIISYFMYFWLTPLFYVFHFPMTMYPFIRAIECAALTLMFVFPVGMALEWYMVSYYNDFLQKYRKTHKYSIPSLYLLGCVVLLFAIILEVLDGFRPHRMADSSLIYVLMTIFVCVLVFIDVSAKRKGTEALPIKKNIYALKIANLIVFSWLPLLLYYLLFSLCPFCFYELLLSLLEFIPTYIAYSNIAVVVFMLGKLNKHFKMAYDNVFKRSVRTYTNENIDEGSDDESGDNNKNQITYNNYQRDIESTLQKVYA